MQTENSNRNLCCDMQKNSNRNLSQELLYYAN